MGLSPLLKYSETYQDGTYEYRHVTLPIEMMRDIYQICDGRLRLMSECEWRALGVRLPRGWRHYSIHRPEPHILLMRRALDGPSCHQDVDIQANLVMRDCEREFLPNQESQRRKYQTRSASNSSRSESFFSSGANYPARNIDFDEVWAKNMVKGS